MKIQQNYDMLNAQAGKLKAVGIVVGQSILGALLFRQIDHAQKHEWGRDFRQAIQTIRAKYPYNHVHDTASISDMLLLFAGADAVRNLSEAPASLPESALAVDLVTQILQERDHGAHDDTSTEYASAVTSDSDSSAKTRRSRKKSNDRRGRSTSRRRGQSRNRRDDSIECRHCDKVNRRPTHVGIAEADCFFNPKRKGWRPEWVCDKLGVEYVPQKHFKDKEKQEKEDKE